jgi:hypothetical protein
MKATVVRGTRPMAQRATRVTTDSAVQVDMYLGSADGEGFKRVDVEISRGADGGLHVAVDLPRALAPAVASLSWPSALPFSCRSRNLI